MATPSHQRNVMINMGDMLHLDMGHGRSSPLGHVVDLRQQMTGYRDELITDLKLVDYNRRHDYGREAYLYERIPSMAFNLVHTLVSDPKKEKTMTTTEDKKPKHTELKVTVLEDGGFIVSTVSGGSLSGQTAKNVYASDDIKKITDYIANTMTVPKVRAPRKKSK